MFDIRTRDVIRRAPPVEGFNVADLPELLSHAYLLISSIRLRSVPTADYDQPTRESIDQLRDIATRLSVYASLAQEDISRTAALYVAATSFQLLSKVPNEDDGGELTTLTVPDSISATLLFLAAGYPADAAEMAQGIATDNSNSPRSVISRDLLNLATGRLMAIGDEVFQLDETLDLLQRAENQLWEQLHRSCQWLALACLGEQELPGAIANAQQGTAFVEANSIHSIRSSSPEAHPTLKMVSAFPAPLKVASLLRIAIEQLGSSASVGVPPPKGSPPEDWKSFAKNRARTRPFLWSNHIEAVRANLLDEGISGVITFPTGAGKSAIAQLKVVATLLAGKRVIYLVPTLALASQVERVMSDLKEELHIDVSADFYEDQIFSEFPMTPSGHVLVMTPERCLFWVGLNRRDFEDVGLIVFDECHLLHAQPDPDFDPRSMDAMLCLLNLLSISQSSDVLLMSAMVSNSDELAAWLETKFNKKTIVCKDAWKPTRQARGSIVFAQNELEQLRSDVTNRKTLGRNIAQRDLVAQPSGLFSLEQVWDRHGRYQLIPIMEGGLQLQGAYGTDRFGLTGPSLSLNSADAAREIAMTAAASGLKTIVFFHNSSSVPAAVRKMYKHRSDLVSFTDRETRLIEAAAIELGGDAHVFKPLGISGGHFGSLLPLERELVESCFKREDGIQVLFSTNTLAQGMNLPADLVVIARTSGRTAEGSVRAISAHELLNAAGRAGRAGFASFGFVIVIPDDIVPFSGGSLSGKVINELIDGVLSQDDRCLTVQDPYENLLDRVTLAQGLDDDQLDSILIRTPSFQPQGGSLTIADSLQKTLAAYHAQAAGQMNEFQSKVQLAVNRRTGLLPADTPPDWLAACRAAGLRPATLKHLGDLLVERGASTHFGVMEWYALARNWLDGFPKLRSQLRLTWVGRSNTESSAVSAWINGSPFVEIQNLLEPNKKPNGLKDARNFARNTIREVSYLVGLVGQLLLCVDLGNKDQIASSASRSAALLRDGFDSIDKLILFQTKRGDLWTRVRTHMECESWLQYVQPPSESPESAEGARRRVHEGINKFVEIHKP
ncbi:MAG: DEAD/DEAH box helicase [Armatimonadetes bacterium]|nr:DEAD/DEAH box helicase [Armatimonadota bacterium]MDE2205360.1 DEAD/DEAH box helicase [Armatimonadota bacterium]